MLPVVIGGIAALVGTLLLVSSLAFWLTGDRRELSPKMCLIVVTGFGCLALSNITGILFGSAFDILLLFVNGYLAASWFGRYRDRRGKSF